MTIRGKIVRLIITLTGLFAIGIFLSDWSESRRLNEFLETFRRDKEINLDKSVENYGNNLKTFAYDYTYWGEMVNFIKSQNRNWAYENLEAVLATFNTHGVWVYEPDFDLVYTVAAPGFDRTSNLPFSKEELRTIFQKSWFNHFFYQSGRPFM